MKPRHEIILILIILFSLALAACGKKGPPFLSEKELSFIVELLRAEFEKDFICLRGTVADTQGREKDVSNIAGCRVYHACYDLDNPPCEGCPIDYGPFKEIQGEITNQGEFTCRIPIKKKKGVHFLKVRLIGLKGEIGPFSDRVKLIIEN